MFGKTRLLISGLGLGAGAMYWFDPQYGKRRRALLRDQGSCSLHRANEWIDKAMRDLGHRIEGTIAEAGGMLDFSTPPDVKLCERVRARLGHVASHPRLIDVEAHDGHVTLRGHAPADEIGRIVLSISTVHGVRSLENELDDQLGPEVSQDGRPRRVAAPIDVMRENWAPGTRLTMGALGGALMLNCAMRRTPTAILMGTLGFGLFLRAMRNRDIGRIVKESAEMASPMLDWKPKGRRFAPSRSE
ncbi:MAG: hypothetical protein ACREHD_14840 [Pirellulales bacterium]